MKKFLRSLSLVMALVMCFTMVFTAAVSAEEDTTTTPVYQVAIDGDTVAPGEEATIDVTASGLLNTVAAIHFEIDLGELTFVDAAPGNVEVSDSYLKSSEDGLVKYVVESPITDGKAEGFADGVLFSIIVKAPETAGTYDVVFTDNIEVQACNVDEEALTLTKVNGAVVVEAEEPECEHEWEFVSAVPATDDGTTDGSITFDCALCDESKTEVVKYNVYFTIIRKILNLESEISILFESQTQYVNILGTHSDLYFVYEQEVVGADPIVGVMHKSEGNVISDGISFPVGIKSTCMNDEVVGYQYVKVGDQWYTGMASPYSVVTYAQEAFTTFAGDSYANLRTAVVDMLRYGSAAQTAFGYDAENLAINHLTAEQQAEGSSTLANDPVNQYVNTAAGSEEAFFYDQQLDASQRVLMDLKFYAGGYTGDKDAMTVKVTYTDFNGNDREETYVNKTVATDEQLAKGKYFTVNASNPALYTLQCNDATAIDMRVAFTFTICDADGNAIGVPLTYSVQSYVYSVLIEGKISDPNIIALSNVMLQYGDSVYKYFDEL